MLHSKESPSINNHEASSSSPRQSLTRQDCVTSEPWTQKVPQNESQRELFSAGALYLQRQSKRLGLTTECRHASSAISTILTQITALDITELTFNAVNQ
jgi:hypothetical protein